MLHGFNFLQKSALYGASSKGKKNTLEKLHGVWLNACQLVLMWMDVKKNGKMYPSHFFMCFQHLEHLCLSAGCQTSIKSSQIMLLPPILGCVD